MSRKAPYEGEIPKDQPPGPPGPPRRSILIENYGPQVISYKGREIQPGTTFYQGFPADREGIEWEKSRRSSDPHYKKGTRLERLVENLNIGTFVVVVLVIAWGVTLWGIWVEFTK